MMLLIIINIRKTKESEMSTLLRIFTNYLQLITTSLTYDVSFPDSLADILYPVDKVGASSETFLSFDCFASDYEIKGSFPSNAFFKLFLVAFLPLILFVFVSLIWVCLRLVNQRIVKSLERNIVISFISIMFLLHPKLTENALSIFRCIDIDDGESRVRLDTSMECYSSEHLKWIAIIGIPILIIWVIAMPIIAFILLWKNIKKSSNKVKQYMLILYQGLKLDKFYWEFVNTIRKVIILSSFALTPVLRILVSAAVLIFTMRLQKSLQPYKNEDNNTIELYALVAGTVTLMTGLVFNSENGVASINMLFLIMLICLNTKFILEWIYLLFLTVKKNSVLIRKILRLLRVLMCKNIYHISPDDRNYNINEEEHDWKEGKNHTLKHKKRHKNLIKRKRKNRKQFKEVFAIEEAKESPKEDISQTILSKKPQCLQGTSLIDLIAENDSLNNSVGQQDNKNNMLKGFQTQLKKINEIDESSSSLLRSNDFFIRKNSNMDDSNNRADMGSSGTHVMKKIQPSKSEIGDSHK